jgi:hypothetical protein
VFGLSNYEDGKQTVMGIPRLKTTKSRVLVYIRESDKEQSFSLYDTESSRAIGCGSVVKIFEVMCLESLLIRDEGPSFD